MIDPTDIPGMTSCSRCKEHYDIEEGHACELPPMTREQAVEEVRQRRADRPMKLNITAIAENARLMDELGKAANRVAETSTLKGRRAWAEAIRDTCARHLQQVARNAVRKIRLEGQEGGAMCVICGHGDAVAADLTHDKDCLVLATLADSCWACAAGDLPPFVPMQPVDLTDVEPGEPEVLSLPELGSPVQKRGRAFRITHVDEATGTVTVEGETESELKALFQRTLHAVAPTHTFWIQSNPKLVQEIRDAGFVVREGVDED